jgi:hypothetical protein
MHKAAFTPNTAAMLLVDHQIGTMAWTHSHDINLVKQNALKLAKIAKAVGLPTLLTSSMEDRVQGPLVPELEQILPQEFAARIKRPGIVNAMHHEGFNKAVKATGRKKLFVAGITTEICVTFPVLQMLDKATRCKSRRTLRPPTQNMAMTLHCAEWRRRALSLRRWTKSSRSWLSIGPRRMVRSSRRSSDISKECESHYDFRFRLS